jgi:phosphoglycolate phosphatase
MKNIKVVAFDCDGVMFDTSHLNESYYNKILDHFGRPPMTSAQFQFVHMQTVDESITFLFDDETEITAAHAYRKTMDYRQFLQYMTIEPHLKRLLDALRPAYKTAIATNRTDTMDLVLDVFDLTDHFDLVVCAKDVNHPKPAPDPILKLITHFKVTPSNVIYIGDSKLDQLAAQAAGVHFAAFKNKALAADFHISGLNEVEKILAA